MNVETIAAFFNWLKQMADLYSLGYLGMALLALYAFYINYQGIINWVVLRIEKDSADGEWTNQEKEDGAVDLYFTQLLPKLPIYLGILKFIPRFIVVPMIRKIIRGICKDAAALKKPAAIKDAV
jgi:hypothetical protein